MEYVFWGLRNYIHFLVCYISYLLFKQNFGLNCINSALTSTFAVIITRFLNGGRKVEPNPESIRMRGMGIFAKQCGGGKRMGKLIGVRGKSFLSKDITKFVTEDLASLTPNIYLMQAFMVHMLQHSKFICSDIQQTQIPFMDMEKKAYLVWLLCFLLTI